MCRAKTWGAWAIVLGLSIWTERSSAESDARVHLGLDTSIYRSTSVDATTTVSGAGGSYSSTSVKFVANSSEFGVPGYTALTLGALLGDGFDLGARLGYQSSKTKVGLDASTPEQQTSAVTLAPYLAYLSGSRADSVRFTLGAFAGIGSGTTKSTATGSGGSTSTSTEATLSSVEYGAFLGLRGFTGGVMSLDPMLMVARTSSTYKAVAGADVDLSGITFMFNIGFTLWSGGSTKPARPAAATAPAAEESDSDVSSRPRPTAVPADKSYRITLNLEDARSVTFVRKPKSDEPDVAVGLRDGDNDIRKSNCSQITLHAPDQEDTVIDVESGMASNSTRRYPVLKGSVPIEKVRLLLIAPTASDAAVPDHWIDVCGERWNLIESERRRLKKYAMGLPKAPPKPEPAPEEAAPVAPVEASPAEPAAESAPQTKTKAKK